MRFSRELGNLKAYLEERPGHPLAGKSLPMSVATPVTIVGTVLGVIGLMAFLPKWMAFLSFPGVMILLASIIAIVNGLLQTPRTDAEKEAMRRFANRNQVRSAYNRKALDQRAGRLLDACAFHRRRILRIVDSPSWTSPARKALRDQTMAAADDAMDDAIAFCVHYTGTGGDASGPWKDLAQDVVDGKLGGAIQKLQVMLQTDSEGHILDKSKLPEDLWPVYDIAMKLQKLAGEVEAINHRGLVSDSNSESSLDQVLHNLSTQRQAEEELNQELQQGT